MNDALQSLLEANDTATIALIGFATLVAFFLLLLLFGRNRSKDNTFVLMGLTGSGKSALFFKLTEGLDVSTHSSLKENHATGAFHDEKIARKSHRPVHLVDLPGHLQLRFQLDTYLPVSAGIILVFDSTSPTTGASTSKAVLDNAELLYDVLSNDFIRKKRTPILVCCHKSDLDESLSPQKIQQLLEDEINKLRQTRQAAPTTQDAERKSYVFLGYDNESFKFDQLGNPVIFEKTSLADTSPVARFVRRFYR